MNFFKKTNKLMFQSTGTIVPEKHKYNITNFYPHLSGWGVVTITGPIRH